MVYRPRTREPEWAECIRVVLEDFHRAEEEVRRMVMAGHEAKIVALELAERVALTKLRLEMSFDGVE